MRISDWSSDVCSSDLSLMREREPCVYMMANGYLGTLYVGVTSNLIGRIMQHREGTFDGFTKRNGCKCLVWYDVADTMEAVIAREKTMKKWPRDRSEEHTSELQSLMRISYAGFCLK